MSAACALAVSATSASQPRAAAQPQRNSLALISPSTRLLVVAPHPDDETLAAGGLMQHVVEAGGQVLVVYLTDGEGYPEAVQARSHVVVPTADDYRDFGKRRQHEARAALAALGLTNDSARFLGFPDAALCKLLRTYWSEHAASFQSPFTRLDRPPRSQAIVGDAEFRGEDLTQELAVVIDRFVPTLIAVPRAEDQHADHCAAWYFVADALGDIVRVRHTFGATLVTYIVHFDDWPFETKSTDLTPPAGLSGGRDGWLRLPLTDAEVARKRAALQKYRTQMKMMSWFLEAFARSNETFARPALPHVVLPARRSLCCH